jgi:hypothetical protein
VRSLGFGSSGAVVVNHQPSGQHAGGLILIVSKERQPMNEIEDRLSRMEAMLTELVRRPAAKPYYSPEEFARLVGREPFTCREYCRLGRIRAQKKASGRGKHYSWVISHEELLRFQREGLLPDRRKSPNTASTA